MKSLTSTRPSLVNQGVWWRLRSLSRCRALGNVNIATVASISDVKQEEWDDVACSHDEVNPFVLHTFLNCLERSGCATPQQGTVRSIA